MVKFRQTPTMCTCVITVQGQPLEGLRSVPPLLLLPPPRAVLRLQVGLRLDESTTMVGLEGCGHCEEAGRYR
jgi:hypothetical protein